MLPAAARSSHASASHAIGTSCPPSASATTSGSDATTTATFFARSPPDAFFATKAMKFVPPGTRDAAGIDSEAVPDDTGTLDAKRPFT